MWRLASFVQSGSREKRKVVMLSPFYSAWTNPRVSYHTHSRWALPPQLNISQTHLEACLLKPITSKIKIKHHKNWAIEESREWEK